MKKRICGLLLAQFLIFAMVPATGFADEEKSRENLANLLNYAQVSIHVITEFNNRVVLDKEYRSIINNLSLREIPDERVIQLLKELMDALTESTLSDREREQVDRLHTAAIKNFSRDFYQDFAFDAVGTSVDVVVSIASKDYAGAGGAIANLGMSYWDYQAQVENMQAEKGEDLWEIENKVIRQLNEINKEMLELSWRLYNEYEIPEAWRLVQKDIAELIKLTRERDVGKRFRLLRHSYMKERFSNYAPYWYYLGSTANQYFIESGDTQYRDEALQAYEHYDVARSPVLKKDEMYASVALGRAQLLDPDKQRDEVIRNLRIIEAAPPENWMTISGMALLYARIGEYEKAREWAQRNIDLGDSDPIFHQQLMGQILGRQGDLKALDQLNSEMVTGTQRSSRSWIWLARYLMSRSLVASDLASCKLGQVLMRAACLTITSCWRSRWLSRLIRRRSLLSLEGRFTTRIWGYLRCWKAARSLQMTSFRQMTEKPRLIASRDPSTQKTGGKKTVAMPSFASVRTPGRSIFFMLCEVGMKTPIFPTWNC